MLTIFGTAKPFCGDNGVIQCNAVTSWTRLRRQPEIILFGDEPGTADLCREFGLGHVADCCELWKGHAAREYIGYAAWSEK